MRHKKTRAAAPRAPRPAPAEVLEAALHDVLQRALLGVNDGTLTVERLRHTLAPELALVLESQGWAIVARPERSSDELELILERHAIAGEIARARLEACSELEGRGPSSVEVEAVFVELLEKKLDALTERLARGER